MKNKGIALFTVLLLFFMQVTSVSAAGSHTSVSSSSFFGKSVARIGGSRGGGYHGGFHGGGSTGGFHRSPSTTRVTPNRSGYHGSFHGNGGSRKSPSTTNNNGYKGNRRTYNPHASDRIKNKTKQKHEQENRTVRRNKGSHSQRNRSYRRNSRNYYPRNSFFYRHPFVSSMIAGGIGSWIGGHLFGYGGGYGYGDYGDGGYGSGFTQAPFTFIFASIVQIGFLLLILYGFYRLIRFLSKRRQYRTYPGEMPFDPYEDYDEDVFDDPFVTMEYDEDDSEEPIVTTQKETLTEEELSNAALYYGINALHLSQDECGGEVTFTDDGIAGFDLYKGDSFFRSLDQTTLNEAIRMWLKEEAEAILVGTPVYRLDETGLVAEINIQ